MKKTRTNEIQDFSFGGATYAGVDIYKVNTKPIERKGMHGYVRDNELTIFIRGNEKTRDLVSKISTGLSKHKTKSKKEIEVFIKGLK